MGKMRTNIRIDVMIPLPIRLCILKFWTSSKNNQFTSSFFLSLSKRINPNMNQGTKETQEHCSSSFYQIEDDMLRICVKFAENDEKNSTECVNVSKSLFVLDYSASMSDDWVQVQNAVKYFIENADSDANNTYFIVYNHKSKLSNISEILSMQADGMTSF
eukprot:269378_1